MRTNDKLNFFLTVFLRTIAAALILSFIEFVLFYA